MKIQSKVDLSLVESNIDIIASTKEELIVILDVLKGIDDTIDAKMEDRTSKIKYSDILYFESVDKKTYAYTLKKTYDISKWLNEIESVMPRQFFRCSKSTIINLAKVNSFSPSFGSKIVMNLVDGEKIYVSRKYVKDLYEKMNGEK